MSIQIRSGAAEVIATGMVTAFLGSPISLLLTDPEAIEVELEFQSDEEAEEVQVSLVRTPNGIRMVCTNFDHPDGRGSAEPVFIMEKNGRTFLLHFRVFRFGRTIDRTVHYTIFSVPSESVVVQFAE